MDWFLYDNGLRLERAKICLKFELESSRRKGCWKFIPGFIFVVLDARNY